MSTQAKAEVKKMLKGKHKPTAVFCLDDEMACGAMSAIKRAGLKCPEDISVLGFDGMEISKFTDPRLSTMERPVSLIAEKAVEILLGKMTDEAPKCYRVQAKLVTRESCKTVE